MRIAGPARALLLVLALTSLPVFGADFKAGAGKSEIQTTPEMLPLENYTSVHDQASVRVLIMDDGAHRFAIAVVETPSIGEGPISVIKTALTKIASVPAENAIVFATHSTSAPHISAGQAQRPANAAPAGGPQGPGPGGPGGNAAPGAPLQAGSNARPAGAPQAGGPGGPGGMFSGPGAALYGKAFEAAVDVAVKQAVAAMQPAKVGYGLGQTSIAVNRDIPTPKGWAQGSNSAGYTDRALGVIRIDAANGNPVAVLYNGPVRSVVMDQSKDNSTGGKALSADLSGAAARYIEQWYGSGTVAFLLMGASVDQQPVLQATRSVVNRDGSVSIVDLKEAGFTLLDMLGERLGADVIQTAEAVKPATQPTISILRKTLKVPSQGRSGSNAQANGPTLSYSYTSGPDVDFPVLVMRIGDVALAGMWPELASVLGSEIKAHSPYANTMVVTMADGGAKYMVDDQSYDRFTGEARGSGYARGASAAVIKSIDDLLGEMKQSPASK